MKTRIELHEKALSVLSLVEAAQSKVNSMMQYNVEIAEPNGFTPHSDEDISFQKLVVARLERSYNNIVKEIVTNAMTR